jgi:hypothetical protein
MEKNFGGGIFFFFQKIFFSKIIFLGEGILAVFAKFIVSFSLFLSK